VWTTGCSAISRTGWGVEKIATCWNELDKGGHFATLEQPELFIEELRSCFRLLR